MRGKDGTRRIFLQRIHAVIEHVVGKRVLFMQRIELSESVGIVADARIDIDFELLTVRCAGRNGREQDHPDDDDGSADRKDLDPVVRKKMSHAVFCDFCVHKFVNPQFSGQARNKII